MSKDYLKVSELNQLIQSVIHAGFPQPVWVCGEIQGYDRNRSKNHIFFELVEKDPRSKSIIAKASLVLFAGRKIHVQDILKQNENAFVLKDDIEVKFACSIDFYPPHGAMRLIVESIDPTFTLGRLAQEKQKLIALLKEKGVLDKNKQMDLPAVPLRIGLITSDDSAAYNDFYSELSKSGFAFQVYLRNTLMQGAKAEQDVSGAIAELQKIEDLDLIVITRGGGSIADLSCFDSQLIAETIARCRLPVLSGIGHEINIAITDMAAHTYAKTPTAIAQFLVSRVQMFLDDLEAKLEIILEGAQAIIKEEQDRLKNCVVGLNNHTRSYFKDHHEQLIRIQEILRQRPGRLLQNNRQSLDNARDVLKRAVKVYLNNGRQRLNSYEKMIDMVHPANTIKRGFSITRSPDGKVLKSIRATHSGDIVHTEVADGVIQSKVQGVKKPL